MFGKKALLLPLACVITLLLTAAGGGTVDVARIASSQTPAPQPQFAYVEQLVKNMVGQLHYARRPLDDDLGNRIFERYLDMLDPNRSYLMAEDVARFEPYRTTLDDAIRRGDLAPAYEIFATYRRRVEERVAYALRTLDVKPDFTVEEEFVFDRENAPWPRTIAEMDELWRKRLKNDLIGLILTGKSWEESRDILRKRYDSLLLRTRQINSEDVFEAFLNAFVQSTDPHSAYFSPRDSEEFRIRMSLSYEGIGAELRVIDEYVQVARVIAGGAADRDGKLQPGDRITGVAQGDGGEMIDVVGWRLDDVVDMIRGPKGSVVRLRVLPAAAVPGSPENVIRLVRDEIKLEERAAQKSLLEIERGERRYRVGVVTIPAFYLDFQARLSGKEDYRSTTRDVRRLIEELKREGIDGLVVDLRDNGGGSLLEATELTGLFIDQGPVVQVRLVTGQVEVESDPEPGVVYDGPLVVLVNRFSASASEIFAGAIQDYGRGLVVGSTTFGKGTIQTLYDLSRYLAESFGPGQLKLTSGKFYRVTGSSTQHKGVIPDIELPSAIDPNEFGESSEPAALPWDQIGPAMNSLPRRVMSDALLKTLAERHQARVAGSREFAVFLKDIEDARKAATRKSVSLVLDKRRAELAELEQARLARENALRQARGLPPLQAPSEIKDDPEAAHSSQDDILLKESAQILVDMLGAMAGSVSLRTAVVR